MEQGFSEKAACVANNMTEKVSRDSHVELLWGRETEKLLEGCLDTETHKNILTKAEDQEERPVYERYGKIVDVGGRYAR